MSFGNMCCRRRATPSGDIWLALICFAPFQCLVRCLAEVYLVQVSNERDFGVLDSFLLVLETVYRLRNNKQSKCERAGNFKFPFQSKGCLLYFHTVCHPFGHYWCQLFLVICVVSCLNEIWE